MKEKELAREGRRNESERSTGNGGDCFARECATREGDEREWGERERERESEGGNSVFENLRRICSYLPAFGAARFTDTLILFKETFSCVDSSALTKSSLQNVQFMEGEATGFGVSRISPLRAFSPTLPGRFALTSSFAFEPVKKRRFLFSSFSRVVFSLRCCPLHGLSVIDPR